MSISSEPRVVFFGPPGAGKSTLAAAFWGRQLEIADTDGTADGDLIAHADRIERDDEETALAGTVKAADALVVAIDAAATDAEVDRTFASVRRFLDSFEAGRTYNRAVAGLPVFLVLTKCDRLPGPKEIAERAAGMSLRFREYLDDGPDGFGSLAVTAVTTGGLPHDGDRFGVTELVSSVTASADAYRGRSVRSGRRVKATVSAAGTLVTALAVGAAAFFFTNPYGPDDPLVARVHAFQAHEGSPVQRLSDARLSQNRVELRGIRDANGFDRLPEELRDYVDARLAEFDAYAAYRDAFNPPRLGPADVRTAAELDRLDADLATTLKPPSEYADAWEETDAGKLHVKWSADAAAVRSAEARIHDWYRGLIRRASGLMLVDPFDPNWRPDGDALLRDAAVLPAKPDAPLPGSPGTPLTYLVPYEFARIDYDKRDWEDARNRLVGLREAVAAVSPGGALDLPKPSRDTAASLALGSARLHLLPHAIQQETWTADRYPDPARTELRRRYRRAVEMGVRHVRAVIREKLPAVDAPADWKPVAEFARTDSRMKDWIAILDRTARTAGDETEFGLADFLSRPSFNMALTGLEIGIPTDLSTQRLAPGYTLTLTYKSAKGTTVEFKLKRIGEPTRRDGEIVAKYAPDGWAGTIKLEPGDSLTASLPVSIEGPDVRLVWDSNRTKTFAFESLSRPAALVPAVGPRTPATGVRATVDPPGCIPAVPILLPDLSGGGKE